MQTSLILLASALAVTSASVISLVPISYIGSTLPSHHHIQNTLTGEYAYSYAGGPSAKEEIKTLDGVTRGAYSYIDAFGIIQSAQYVADDHGFRIAATDIPTDSQFGGNVPLETPDVQIAKIAHFGEHAKAVAALGRKKRSLGYAAASVPTAVSSQYRHQTHESVKLEAPVHQEYISASPLTYATYQHLPVSVATVPSAVSHQSHIQTHNGANLEGLAPVNCDQIVNVIPGHKLVKAVPDQLISYHLTAEIPQAAHISRVAVSSVPTAISKQSRYQIHNNQKIELHGPVHESLVAPVVPVAKPDLVAITNGYRTALPLAAAISSVPTAVSSQTRTQIHNGQRLEIEAPKLYASQAINYGHPAFAYFGRTLAAPLAVSSQSRFQVHSGEKLEIETPVHGSSHLLSQVPLDTPEVAAAKQAHAKAYAEELVKHQGW